MNETAHDTVHQALTAVRDNMSVVFDLNTSDEFIDTITDIVVEAIRHAHTCGGAGIASIDRRDLAGHIAAHMRQAMYYPGNMVGCASCGAYVDADIATRGGEDALALCDACRENQNAPRRARIYTAPGLDA